jgi:hypothetical protein
MERLFPRYVETFRRKETPYRSLLREGAEALEIGSHFGAFLKVAAEWGWKPVGIDVGRDTAGFARSKGLVTYRGTLQDCRFPTARFEAVFVWNCFERTHCSIGLSNASWQHRRPVTCPAGHGAP